MIDHLTGQAQALADTVSPKGSRTSSRRIARSKTRSQGSLNGRGSERAVDANDMSPNSSVGKNVVPDNLTNKAKFNSGAASTS